MLNLVNVYFGRFILGLCVFGKIGLKEKFVVVF